MCSFAFMHTCMCKICPKKSCGVHHNSLRSRKSLALFPQASSASSARSTRKITCACASRFSRVYCLQNTTSPRHEALIRLESSSMATWRPPCLSPSYSHAPILRHSNRSHPACCNLPLFQRVKRLVIVQGMSRWQADPGADGIRALTSRRPICPL